MTEPLEPRGPAGTQEGRPGSAGVDEAQATEPVTTGAVNTYERPASIMGPNILAIFILLLILALLAYAAFQILH